MIAMPLLTAPVIAPGGLARLSQPVLEVNDFVLRPWQPSDASAVAGAYSKPSIQHWHARSMTDDEARTWVGSWTTRWQQESGAGWAVVNRSGLLGQISLRQLNLVDGLAEVSYWVLYAARGRGVATRALSAVTTWGFNLGLHRMEIHHSTLNPASCGVAERAGYPMEGTKRGQALHADGWHDMHLHARLIDDP